MQAASLSKIWRFDGNVGPEDMDSSSFQGLECMNEFPKPNGLSVSERREMIHALSKQPEEASELLNSWSRNEIMKIICAEMGKERKYTGLNKPKLIENLLNLVSRPLGETVRSDHHHRRNSRKKQETIGYIVCCENLACRAALGSDDTFCRRCSCCICHKFDDNKDPSLWLTCEACGLCCHLKCGLRQERYGIGKDFDDDDGERGLDGMFCCAFCGKDNDLLGCWRKQVKVAKETLHVDVLCYRVSLGQKLLRGTRKYRNLLELLDEAVRKLEGDVGPLSGWAVKKARGIVNRLSSGSQVQKLCSLAMEALDKIVPPSESVSKEGDKMSLRVEEIQARSVNVSLDSEERSTSLENRITGFRLFCQKSKDEECSSQVSSIVYLPETRSTIEGLEPETEFSLRAVSFNEEGDLDDESEIHFSTPKDDGDDVGNRQCLLTNSSSSLCSNPSSLPEDESNNVGKSCSKENGEKDNTEHCSAGEVESEIEDRRLREGKDNKKGRRDLLVTSCKRDTSKGKQGGNKRTRSIATMNEKPEINAANGVGDKDLSHIVKTIRCLEKEGHINKSFRERFLTWYSLRATNREVRVVKIFVETFMDDLSSLGQQLVDTFSECITSKRSSTTGVVPAGICLKLWH